MDLGTVMSVAQTLFAALKCSEIKEFCSLFGYKSELEKLQSTVATISSVLRDAEAKQEMLSEQEKLYIEELKDAVYDADDVFDEFFTLAKQKRFTKGGATAKVSDKVRHFLSRFKPVAFDMARKVKMVRKKLDAIAGKHTQFSFKVNYQPIRRRREETCSYVYANDIIGRDADLGKIVGMLLDSFVERDVSCLSIVGIGGLGKTALAQLVYNDERVENAFLLKLWTCVSDQDQEKLNVTEILGKILGSATGTKSDGSSKDQVQIKLREKLVGKKYLLVLDDVWNENRDEWIKLAGFLMGGQRGSWILVTTRSRETARIIGNGPTYELEGLSKADSWSLFEKTAFEPEQNNLPSDDLVSIGHEIVEKCASVPLAIRAIGSLLYGQPKSKWLSFQAMGLATISEGEHDIMPILKLSYHHLKYPLKSCFTYCALFPKDFRIDKEMLISLWMAQDYIVPRKGQSMEDAGEEYFLILLRRCFLQDVKKDEYGEILSCKIHDLMHDIAQQVAGKEIFIVANTNPVNVDNNVRHLSLASTTLIEEDLFAHTRTRTCFRVDGKIYFSGLTQSLVGKILSHCPCLRTLDLSGSGIKNVPESIGKLLHLRYLDVSCNKLLEALPRSVTKLYNLQTLKLAECYKLKELPKDLSKLVNLRALDISYCYMLSALPLGMSRLTSLQRLDTFRVGMAGASMKQFFDELENLQALNNLKGDLEIRIHVPKDAAYVKEDNRGGAYLMRKEYLNQIRIEFTRDSWAPSYAGVNCEKALLEELQPHSNVRHFSLHEYRGRRMPMWATEDNLMTSLRNLVSLRLWNCPKLQCLPELGKLPHLKVLDLRSLDDLEYVDSNPAAGSAPGLGVSLELLALEELPKLKEWWPTSAVREGDNHILNADNNSQQGHQITPCLSQLKTLHLFYCPQMTSIPICPRVERVSICDSNSGHLLELSNGPSSFWSNSAKYPNSWRLLTNNVKSLIKLMPMGHFHPLTVMKILYLGYEQVESLSEVEELFQSCLSALRSLKIDGCPKIRSLCGGLEHLTALEELVISNTPSLLINAEEEVMPWQSLPQTLHSLKLKALPQLVNLPKGIQCLTNLQSLEINDCPALESLPKWMPKLTSLKELQLRRCSARLEESCRNPTGEDWPSIQHIPRIIIEVDERE